MSPYNIVLMCDINDTFNISKMYCPNCDKNFKTCNMTENDNMQLLQHFLTEWEVIKVQSLNQLLVKWTFFSFQKFFVFLKDTRFSAKGSYY